MTIKAGDEEIQEEEGWGDGVAAAAAVEDESIKNFQNKRLQVEEKKSQFKPEISLVAHLESHLLPKK